MTPEQRLNAANEINKQWVHHIRHGDAPPDVNTVAAILEQYELGESVDAKRRRNPCVVRLKLVDSGA